MIRLFGSTAFFTLFYLAYTFFHFILSDFPTEYLFLICVFDAQRRNFQFIVSKIFPRNEKQNLFYKCCVVAVYNPFICWFYFPLIRFNVSCGWCLPKNVLVSVVEKLKFSENSVIICSYHQNSNSLLYAHTHTNTRTIDTIVFDSLFVNFPLIIYLFWIGANGKI